jgi:hypothetical protein
LIFQQPSCAAVTEAYFSRYDAISDFLDAHPRLVQKAHQELTKPLRHAKRKGPQGQNCTYSSDTVLRLYLVKVLEDLTFRGTVVRVTTVHACGTSRASTTDP